MRLEAYKCIFKHKKGEDSTPIRETLVPIPYDVDDGFVITTHDRGEDGRSREYYQIVFSLTDVEDEDDWTVEQQMGFAGSDHAQVPCERKQLFSDKSELPHLWYHKVKLTRRELKSDTRTVTAAGISEVCVRSKSDASPVATYRVTVLPCLFTQNEYEFMVGRILGISDRLACFDQGDVGMGRSSDMEAVPGTPEWDCELWKRLKPHVRRVMELPDQMLKRNYQRMPTQKIRRFGTRTMQSYLSGPQGDKALGVTYANDHDTLENRVIKAILNQMLRRVYVSRLSSDDIPSSEEVHGRVRDDWNRERAGGLIGDASTYERRLGQELPSVNPPNAIQTSRPASVPITLESTNIVQEYESGSRRHKQIRFWKDQEGQYHVATSFHTARLTNLQEGEEVSDFVYYPLTYCGRPSVFYRRPCIIELTTPAPAAACSSLRAICGLYKTTQICRGLRIVRQHTLQVKGDAWIWPIVDRYRIDSNAWDNGRDACFLLVNNVTECVLSDGRDEGQDDDPSSEDSVNTVQDLLKCVQSVSEALPEDVEFLCEWDGDRGGLFEYYEFSMRRHTSYERQYEPQRGLLQARQELEMLLADPWFATISDIGTTSIPNTPRFLHDPTYRSVYRLMHESLCAHPSCNFDAFAFGVHETRLVYEYWGFSELLDHLVNLGFVLDENNGTPPALEWQKHIARRDSNTAPEGFSCRMRRSLGLGNQSEDVRIEVGFNCSFKRMKPEKGHPDSYRPDYYLRVFHPGGDHWYFMDAKYAKYGTALLESTKPYDKGKSIPAVCIEKYIKGIDSPDYLGAFYQESSRARPGEEMAWQEMRCGTEFGNVRGSYLIIAGLDQASTISVRDGLYGVCERGDGLSPDAYGLSAHSFGAVVVKPSDTSELATLLQLIFEYKETVDDSFDFGQSAFSSGNLDRRSPVLRACWNSSVRHDKDDGPSVRVENTQRHWKFYFSCPCGDMRVETYCFGCGNPIYKHDVGNYHARNNRSDRWNFKCPKCGNDLSQADDNSDQGEQR